MPFCSLLFCVCIKYALLLKFFLRVVFAQGRHPEPSPLKYLTFRVLFNLSSTIFPFSAPRLKISFEKIVLCLVACLGSMGLYRVLCLTSQEEPCERPGVQLTL